MSQGLLQMQTQVNSSQGENTFLLHHRYGLFVAMMEYLKETTEGSKYSFSLIVQRVPLITTRRV